MVSNNSFEILANDSKELTIHFIKVTLKFHLNKPIKIFIKPDLDLNYK